MQGAEPRSASSASGRSRPCVSEVTPTVSMEEELRRLTAPPPGANVLMG
jgi:hypothetical protein